MPRILIVEDNELNRDMLVRRLTRKGFEVAVAIDGRGALAAVAAGGPRPDVILMDLRLPDVSGWEVTRALKADPATAAIPVLALTAHAMEGDREEALKAGCDDYDTKPVDLPRLLEKIQALLAKRGA